MVNMKESKRLLNIAVSAALDAALPEFEAFDADHELHKMFEEDELYVGFRDSLVIAETTDSEYGVLIQPVVVPTKIKTIAKTIVEDRVMFNIFYPTWDEGDWSVGIPSMWILDPDDGTDPDEVAESAHEAALEAITWIVKNEIRDRMNNALEADYWRRDREQMAEFEL